MTEAQKPAAMADERARFEAWVQQGSVGTVPRIISEGAPCAGEYEDRGWQAMWEAWQARAALDAPRTTDAAMADKLVRKIDVLLHEAAATEDLNAAQSLALQAHEALHELAFVLSATRTTDEGRAEAVADDAARRDARRYRRLQVIGAAPCDTKELEQGTVLRFTDLDAWVDADLAAHPSRGEADRQRITPHAPEAAPPAEAVPVALPPLAAFDAARASAPRTTDEAVGYVSRSGLDGFVQRRFSGVMMYREPTPDASADVPLYAAPITGRCRTGRGAIVSDNERSTFWIPRTPGGTDCLWLSESTEDRAWAALMKDAAHMPYPTKAAFVERGYTVNEWEAGRTHAKEST